MKGEEEELSVEQVEEALRSLESKGLVVQLSNGRWVLAAEIKRISDRDCWERFDNQIPKERGGRGRKKPKGMARSIHDLRFPWETNQTPDGNRGCGTQSDSHSEQRKPVTPSGVTEDSK